MIEFNKIRLRNFCSFGNVPVEIDLSKYRSNYISGANGAGKSSAILDSLCFALFGKPYRNIKTAKLINSINLRDCHVSIEFRIGTKDYVVNRGMKPMVFEILENGVLIDQEAAIKNYQAYLERKILGLTFKTFRQVLVLGSAVYTPFMQLSPQDRTAVIDDVLDIGVYSRMMQQLKADVSKTKESLKLLDIQVAGKKAEAIAQKKVIDFLVEQSETHIAALEERALKEHFHIENLNESIASMKAEVLALREVPSHQDEIDSLNMSISTENQKINTLRRRIASISGITGSTCPTCTQEVSSELGGSIETGLNQEISDHEQLIAEHRMRLQAITELQIAYTEARSRISKINGDLQIATFDRNQSADRLDEIRAEIESTSAKAKEVEDERRNLKKILIESRELFNRRDELEAIKDTQGICYNLIPSMKSAVIKEYVPLMNKLINEYLADFGFFVSFEMDENFVETIRSRGRDEFTYFSFSEGEKKRIDISILLAFRKIAAMKNSCNINLLVSDEIDGGLDSDSLYLFVDLMTNGSLNSNTWVISHVLQNTNLKEYFEANHVVSKVGDFSAVEVQTS